MGVFALLKSFHLIFMVSWFAGLFFLGRMMIYHAELSKETGNAKALIEGGMRRVMSIIVWPSLIVTVMVGLHLAMATHAFKQPWFHVKMLLVALFIGYTHGLWSLSKKMISGKKTPSLAVLRLMNELPFIFLLTIVFLVFMKNVALALFASAVCIGLFTVLGLVYRSFCRKSC